MSQSIPIPSLEDILWAELLSPVVVKQLERNKAVLCRFAANGWVTNTSRRDEFAITASGRKVAEKRLAENWITWKQDLELFRTAGFSPEDPSAWRMVKRLKVGHLPREVKEINRRTLAAWERRHSKSSFNMVSMEFQDTKVTIDEVTRIRVPAGSRLLLKDGTAINCDLHMATFGELNIPERGWKNIQCIDTPNSLVLFSIENKGAFVDFPEVCSVTLLFVPGNNTSAIGEVISRLPQQPAVHFGDLDPKGIEIYETLRREGLALQHFVPSYAEEFLPTHAQSCEMLWPKRDFSSFDPIIAKLASTNDWLEQEALVLDQRFQGEIEALTRRIYAGGNGG